MPPKIEIFPREKRYSPAKIAVGSVAGVIIVAAAVITYLQSPTTSQTLSSVNATSTPQARSNPFFTGIGTKPTATATNTSQTSPVMNSADERINTQRAAQVLDIARALDDYGRTHGGVYPASLDILTRGGYITISSVDPSIRYDVDQEGSSYYAVCTTLQSPVYECVTSDLGIDHMFHFPKNALDLSTRTLWQTYSWQDTNGTSTAALTLTYPPAWQDSSSQGTEMISLIGQEISGKNIPLARIEIANLDMGTSTNFGLFEKNFVATLPSTINVTSDRRATLANQTAYEITATQKQKNGQVFDMTIIMLQRTGYVQTISFFFDRTLSGIAAPTLTSVLSWLTIIP